MFNQGMISFGAGGAGGGSVQGGGSSGVQSINGIIDANIYFAGVSGIWIDRQDSTLYIAASGVDLTGSGFATYNNLHQSGYIRNVNFVQSGYITKAEIASSGFIQAIGATFVGDRTATWFFAQYNHNSQDFDHAYFLKNQSVISDVVLYGNSPSGNFIVSLSSGFPGTTPIQMYTGNQKPTISGIHQVSSGLLPDIVTLPQGAILYANVENIPADASGIRLSVHFDASMVGSGYSGLLSINSITGPLVTISGQSGIRASTVGNQIILETSGVFTRINNIAGPTLTIRAGSGVHSIIESGSVIYINTSGSTGTGNGLPESDQYPVDARPVSGNIIPDNDRYYHLGSQTSRFNHLHASSGNFYGANFPYNPISPMAGIILHSGVGLEFNRPNNIFGGRIYSRTDDGELRASGYTAFALAERVIIGAQGINGAHTDGVLNVAWGNNLQELINIIPAIGQTGKAVRVRNLYDNRTETAIGSSGELWVERRRITSEYSLEWNYSNALSIVSGFDNARLIRWPSEIKEVSCYTQSPSGNVTFSLSSGFPNTTPVSLYNINSLPIASGTFAMTSGSLPDTVLIPGGVLLYANINSVPSGANAFTASGACVQVFLERQTEVL